MATAMKDSGTSVEFRDLELAARAKLALQTPQLADANQAVIHDRKSDYALALVVNDPQRRPWYEHAVIKCPQ